MDYHIISSMLEVSSLRSPSKVDHQRGFVGDHVVFPTSGSVCDDFMVDDNLLDYIDFSCDAVPFFDADGDILPDLEVDPTELLAEFSSPETSPTAADGCRAEAKPPDDLRRRQPEEEAVVLSTSTTTATTVEEKKAERVLSAKDEKLAAAGVSVTTRTMRKKVDGEGSSAEEDSGGAGSDTKWSASAGGHGKKKTAAADKNSSSGKRKVKVLIMIELLASTRTLP